ncbi:hypothetical protein ACFX19_034089 [Malus domestica]
MRCLGGDVSEVDSILLEKAEELNKKENKAAERLKSRYPRAAVRKQSRRVIVCTEAEVPSSSSDKRRSSQEVLLSSAKWEFTKCWQSHNPKPQYNQ